MSVNKIHSHKEKNDPRLLDLVKLQRGELGSILVLQIFSKLKT
jgi:hypothetical protein